MAGTTRALAEFVQTSRWEDVPEVVRHEAKRSLVNFFAVSLGSCKDPTIDKAAAVLGRFSAGRSATLIGRGERTDLLNAAALNAMSANVFDFCDTHAPTIIHPTSPVAPALIALAEARPVSGAQLLHAFVLGVQVACRIGNAVSPWHYDRGWHITSTCGVFGAAAGSGKLLGLDARQFHWAFGGAASQACGLVETLGTMAKSLAVGNAARNGLLSAMLAQEGFDGPAQPLEGVRGFLNVTGEKPDFGAVTDELGGRWEIRSVMYKPYPCGVVLNPVIDACLRLRTDPALDVSKIERIELVGHPLLRARTDRPGVATGRQSQVSAQHAVGVALTTGRAGMREFSDTAVADPAIQALGRKLRFIDDETLSIDAIRMTVLLEGGRRLEASIDHALGSLKNPMSDRALEEKLRELCRAGGSGCDPAPLIDALWGLDRAADAGVLLKLAAGRSTAPADG